MAEIQIGLEQLRGMIGQLVRHRGVSCHVIEVLEDGPSLVLEDTARHGALQNDQYGEPRRRVRRIYTIPVVAPDRRGLHDDFLALELLEND